MANTSKEKKKRQLKKAILDYVIKNQDRIVGLSELTTTINEKVRKHYSVTQMGKIMDKAVIRNNFIRFRNQGGKSGSTLYIFKKINRTR